MKLSLLLLLSVPMHAFAQFGPTYTGPTMQQNQQSREYFNRSMNQRTQDFQMRQINKNRPSQGMRVPAASPETQQEAQARQLQAEKEANEQLARLAQEQQRKRDERPAPNPQQAAARQKEDERQLALLALKNYRDVFLPGQLANALQARYLSPAAASSLQRISDKLLNDAWWSKQEPAQLTATVKAYSDSLTSLTTSLLGFDLASPPPTPDQLSSKRVDDLLAKNALTQQAGAQIVQEVATAEKLIAGNGLAKAVVDFNALNTPGPNTQALQSDPKKLRQEVQARLRRVSSEMQRYESRIGTLSRLPNAQKTMHDAMAIYLKKQGS